MSDPVPPSAIPARFAIRAARLISGVTLDDIDLEVSAATSAEAKEMLHDFWSRLGVKAPHPEPVDPPVKSARVAELEMIRAEMAKRGWNQSDLSRATGIATSLLSSIFTGVAGITPPKRKAIYDALNLKHQPPA